MTAARQEFFKFAKDQSGVWGYIPYTDSPVANQQVVRLIITEDVTAPVAYNTNYVAPYTGCTSQEEYTNKYLATDQWVIIDPNWEKFYEDFILMTGIDDTVNQIKADRASITSREQAAQYILENFIKPLLSCNINRPVVYVVTKDHSGWNSDIWTKTVTVNGVLADVLGK